MLCMVAFVMYISIIVGCTRCLLLSSSMNVSLLLCSFLVCNYLCHLLLFATNEAFDLLTINLKFKSLKKNVPSKVLSVVNCRNRKSN
ncbi:hypothetical protein L6452_41859 [Arctium lappa]|uniref:Uncharacterized protein n=1 Tax=Arctium lappa TaxID=4217 RepID=A0ACB8XGL8_ARCLA|nr:hypothetical protein L6452_41859 [Arctium lappa]